MKIKTAFVFKTLAIIVLASSCSARMKLAPLFTDHMVLQQNARVPVWGWAEPGAEVKATGSWDTNNTIATRACQDGKWMLELPTPSAGGPFTLIAESDSKITLEDVLIGEVWLCSGQSNMDWSVDRSYNAEQNIAGSSNYTQIRLFQVEQQAADEPVKKVGGKWQLSSPASVEKFSAVAYSFGRHLYENLEVPIGLVQSSWGGTSAEVWTRLDYLESEPALNNTLKRFSPERLQQIQQNYQQQLSQWEEQEQTARHSGQRPPERPNMPGILRPKNQPSKLFNGMISPLVPFKFQGVIWYQGEANRHRAEEYSIAFPLLIRSWREIFGHGPFAFYFVQLAPFNAPGNPNIAVIRESQLKTMQEVKNTGMVVITDLVDDINKVHPRSKDPVGKRLALWALAKTYAIDNIVYSGPVYRAMDIQGNKIWLKFDHMLDGLKMKGNELTHFEIAGQDRVFHKAQAVIKGEQVVVSSPEVSNPVAVRFGFHNAAKPNLFNKAGLPASPFRTDKWPVEFD